jgi:hypothetical protein
MLPACPVPLSIWPTYLSLMTTGTTPVAELLEIDMNILKATLTAALVATTATAAFADSPTNRQKAEQLWVATGDAAYGRQAGLTDAQINGVRHLPYEQVDLSNGSYLSK